MLQECPIKIPLSPNAKQTKNKKTDSSVRTTPKTVRTGLTYRSNSQTPFERTSPPFELTSHTFERPITPFEHPITSPPFILSLFAKLSKENNCFILVSQEVCPCKSRVVINNNKCILFPTKT